MFYLGHIIRRFNNHLGSNQNRMFSFHLALCTVFIYVDCEIEHQICFLEYQMILHTFIYVPRKGRFSMKNQL